MTPKILLVTTCRWPSTARLAIALADVGCVVEAICPSGHPARKTDATSRSYPYRGFAPLGSVAAAVVAAQPDIIIPCDDLATMHLHELYRRAVQADSDGATTRALIERSLGMPSGFPIAIARTGLIDVARELGIRVPPTAVVETMEDLSEWLARYGFPAVMKADGTYGARGVRIVASCEEAGRAMKALGSPPSAARAIKRALVNGDPSYAHSWLSRTRAVVNVQQFVEGREATSAVACWRGKVLASITVFVVQTAGRNGPSSVVQVCENREISCAIEKIVAKLGISGMLGFDFIIEDRTGDPYLIEMNPRSTQMAHLPLGEGRDLVAALCGALIGKPVCASRSVTDKGLIALFPQEWLRDAKSPYLNNAYHDVPWGQPDLMRACLETTIMERVWSNLALKVHRVRNWLVRQD